MSHAVELVSDGDNLAVLGHSDDVERFIHSAGLTHAPARDFDLARLRSLTGAGAAAAQIGADIAANSGRWVKLTAESAADIKRHGLTPTKTPGVSYAMAGDPGDIKKWLQIAHTPSALLTGPLALTALSTMMQQQAMQQQMDEIVEYLQTITEKVDDILRNQKDAVLADMIGVDLIIEDALTVRDHVGRVSQITWSKVQATGMTLARTQGYALRQLDSISEKLHKKTALGETAKATQEADPKIQEWLAVLARTVQLQDGVSILELDRILDDAPEDLSSHRLGLATARQKRVELITRSTTNILLRMDEAVQRANKSVLLNPFDSPAVVRASTQVATAVHRFQERLGIDGDRESEAAKRWSEAAVETRDKVITSASKGLTVAGRASADTLGRASEPFRAVDIDGDGFPDKPRAATIAENAGSRVAGAMHKAIGKLAPRKRRNVDGEAPPETSSQN